ncbi:hypothetical protein FHG87_019285 [Trinorchestia longiramus]|nr:hypothetical protein FHG87_019285 [Trinorchestia longiramus]
MTQTAKLTSIRGPQTSGNIQTGENSKNFKPDQVSASQTPKPGSAPGKQAQSSENAPSGTAPASKTNQSGPAQAKPSQGSKTTTVTAPAAAKSVGGKTVQTHSTQPKQSVQTITTQPKQSVQTSTTQPKQSVQKGTSQPKQSVPTSTTQPKQSVQTSTTQSTKPVQPRSTQPMKPLQTSSIQPAKPTQTSTRQPDVPVPVSSSQPDAEVLSELTRPFGTFQASTSERDSDILTGNTFSQTPPSMAAETLCRVLLQHLQANSPTSLLAGAPTGAPAGVPVGAPTGPVIGPGAGTPLGTPLGAPAGLLTGAPAGVPVGAPTGPVIGAPTGAPAGTPLGAPAGLLAGAPAGVSVGAPTGPVIGAPTSAPAGTPLQHVWPLPVVPAVIPSVVDPQQSTLKHGLLSAELAQISSELDMDMGAILRNREGQLRAQHEVQMRRMMEEHARSMETLRLRLREQEEVQTKQSDEKQNLMKETHAAKIMRLEHHHEEELSNLKSRYRRDLEEADFQIKTDLIQKRNEWENKLSLLKAEIKSQLPDHDSGTESSSFDVDDMLRQSRKQRKKKRSGHFRDGEFDTSATFHLIETARESVESQLKHLKEKEKDVINTRQQLSEKVKGLQSIIEPNLPSYSAEATRVNMSKPLTSQNYEEYVNGSSRDSSDHNDRKYMKPKKEFLGDKRKQRFKKEERSGTVRKATPQNLRVHASKSSSDSLSVINGSSQTGSRDESPSSHSSDQSFDSSNDFLKAGKKQIQEDSNKRLGRAGPCAEDIEAPLNRLCSTGHLRNSQEKFQVVNANSDKRSTTKLRGKNNPETKHRKKNIKQFIDSKSDSISNNGHSSHNYSSSTLLTEDAQLSSENESPKAKLGSVSRNKFFRQRLPKKSVKSSESSQFSADDMDLMGFQAKSYFNWKDDPLLKESRRLSRDADALLKSDKFKSVRFVNENIPKSFDDFAFQEVEPNLSFRDRLFEEPNSMLTEESDSDDHQLSEVLRNIRKKHQRKQLLNATDNRLSRGHSAHASHTPTGGGRPPNAVEVSVKPRPMSSSLPSRDRITPLEGMAGWPVRLGSKNQTHSRPVYNEKTSSDLTTRVDCLKEWLRRNEGTKLANGKV